MAQSRSTGRADPPQRILIGRVVGDTGPAGPGYSGTSTTSLTIGATGSRTLTAQPGLAYTVGARVRVANSTANWMEGTVTAYNATTGALTFTADLSGGTGTLTSWNIGLAGTRGQQGLAATVNLGSVTTLPPGTQATVTPGGTPEARTFSFGIPQGQSGPQAGIPALEIQLSNSTGNRYWVPNYDFRLLMVNGSLQAGDRVYLLRWSYTGNSRNAARDGSYVHDGRNNQPHLSGMHISRYSRPPTNARSGFRHPPHRTAAGQLIGKAPKWGTQLATEWIPEFYPPWGGPAVPGSSMRIFINWREMMRYKSMHRRRGTERIKFVIARGGGNAGYGDTRYPLQYGDCLNTLIVRLHNHRGSPGAANRIVSVTVRP